MVEEQYLRELSSSLIIFEQSKINSSLTNKTIQLLNTQQKINKINKWNNLILYKQIPHCRMSINSLEMGI